MPDPTYYNSEESHGHDNFTKHIQNYTTGQHQIPSGDTIDPDKIPPLEEDWDNGQFADADINLINRHNTHSESERIRREYTQHLLNLSNNQYYYEENPINQLQYSNPDPNYYRTLSRRSQTQPHDPSGYYPHHQIQQMFSAGTHVEEENVLFCTGIDFLEKRLNQLKAGKPEREDKTISNR